MDFLERQGRIQTKITNKNSKPQQNKQTNNFVAHKKGHSSNRPEKPSRNSQSLNFNSTAENTSVNNSTQQTDVCVFCEGPRLSKNCKEVLTLDERKEKLTHVKACFRCFKRNHAASNCRSNVKCSRCSNKHYPVMCSRQGNSPMQTTPPAVCNLTTSLVATFIATRGRRTVATANEFRLDLLRDEEEEGTTSA